MLPHRDCAALHTAHAWARREAGTDGGTTGPKPLVIIDFFKEFDNATAHAELPAAGRGARGRFACMLAANDGSQPSRVLASDTCHQSRSKQVELEAAPAK